MNNTEAELEARLDALPNSYPGFTRAAMYILKRHGLVEAVLEMLEERPDATADDVTMFDCEYRGAIELYDGDGQRAPVEVGRLVLTREMRDMLADLKGKTFKAFECIAASKGRDDHSDGVIGITLGQHAIHIFNRDFPFIVVGVKTELTALRCERKSLRDDFGLPPDAPVRAYAVGERVTGVELVTDHAVVLRGNDADALDVDVAVAVRTAHAVYTFARESWRSTDIRVATSDEIVVPYALDEINAGWLGLLEDSGIAIGETSRTVAKLA